MTKVDNSGILFVVFALAPVYISLCRGQEYLLKVWYIILVDPLWFSTLFFVTEWKHCPISEKYHKNWRHLRFVAYIVHQTFTKCVSNQHTHFNMLTCQMYYKVQVKFQVSEILKSFFCYVSISIRLTHKYISR